jgi:hypothetical protein
MEERRFALNPHTETQTLIRSKIEELRKNVSLFDYKRF